MEEFDELYSALCEAVDKTVGAFWASKLTSKEANDLTIDIYGLLIKAKVKASAAMKIYE